MAEQKYDQYEIKSGFSYHLKTVQIGKSDQTITYIYTCNDSDEERNEIDRHVRRIFDATSMEMAESKTVFDAGTSKFQLRYTFQGVAALASWEKIKNYSSYKEYDFQAPNAAIPKLFSTASMPEESGDRSKMHSALNGITIEQLKASHQAKEDQEIKELKTKQTEVEAANRTYQDRIIDLEKALKSSNDDAEKLRRQISDQQQQIVFAKAASQEAEKLMRQAEEKEDLANLTLGLGDIPFLSSENKQGLAGQLKTATRENKLDVLNTLRGISALFLKAEVDFKHYNQHYIRYVESLTWWQRILRNHGRTGLYRAMRSKENMTEEFRAIQKKYNTAVSDRIKNPSTQVFNQLYREMHSELIKAAEKQLVDMRSNYFDSSNLNLHSYATYLTRFILNLKDYRPTQNNLELNENRLPSYDPLFTKPEDIKLSCEQLIAEYRRSIHPS